MSPEARLCDTADVIRSGTAGLMAIVLSAFFGVGVLAAVVFSAWTAAVVLGALALAVFGAGLWLIVRADAEELAARARRNEKGMEAWARGVAKASGGWVERERR
jgi:hypothetical protein